MTTNGGDWAVFQRRMDGSVNFYRNWTDYKTGFGNLTGEFWLGLDKLHRLASCNQVLRVDLGDFEGNTSYAQYDTFLVGDENSRYVLAVGQYSGNSGDSLTHHNEMKFSTNDSDNDASTDNCAIEYSGAWWYKNCHASNLNGLYLKGKYTSYANGVTWYAWKGHQYSLK